MAKHNVWMPLFVADLIADTTHLSRADFGSYVLLMCSYWRRRKPLPDDDRALSDAVGGVQSQSQSHSLERAQSSADRPSLEEVLAYAQRIGLAPWKATDWFQEMEGGGWLDHNHRPIVNWRAVLDRVRTKWEADGRPMRPPAKPRIYETNRTPDQRGAAQRPDRNAGTCNEGNHTKYGNLGKVARPGNVQRQFARGLVDGKPPFWLSLLGKSGTGKTHCAKRLWSLRDKLRWDHTNYFPELIYWPKFIEELRESVRDGLGLGRLLDIGRWPLAVLDDVEATRDPTGFASKNLNLLLGMRVGKWTVLTSNLDLAGLSKIDDRIASRIIREPGNLFIEMTTEDYGLRPKR